MGKLLGAAYQLNRAGMQPLDWGILFGMIIFLVGVLLYCNRYMRNAADFLAAGRCAGRYVLSISEGIAGFAVVNTVSKFEMFYEAGFSSQWWAMLDAPLGLALSLVAWVTYRMRETRCFTLGQFYEVRYSRKFRIAAGILTWIAGVWNYGIFPAVSVRFFMFFCHLPTKFSCLGIQWDTFAVLLFFAIGIGVFFAVAGGQIAIMITDFIQGVFCNVAFVIFILFIFKLGSWDIFGGMISWDQIADSLSTTEGMSQIDPFDTTKIKGFNIWFFLIGIISTFYVRGGWQGSMGYAAAAKSPHERKMAGIISTWRGMAQALMILLLPLAVIVIMNHPDFAAVKDAVTAQLDASGATGQLKEQGRVTTAISLLMPTGMLGLFVAVMFAAMLSTDDTYMHSWGSIFIQDVVMPFRKKPFTPKQHILALRLSVVFVGVIAWIFSYFLRQTDFVMMFFAITGAIVSGSGAAIIGGLYWKRGGTIAAWVSYITSATVAISGLILQQVWDFGDGTGLSYWLAKHFHWQWVIDNINEAQLASVAKGQLVAAKFPINGQWITLICIVLCVTLYVVVSLIEHYVAGKPDFNLDKMLHRGKYDTNQEHADHGKVNWFYRKLGITEEFTPGDKIIYLGTVVWTLFWFIFFVWFTVQHFTVGVPDSQWLMLWHIKIFLTVVIGIGCTIWLLIGGIRDSFGLFKALKNSVRNDADNGTVINGSNAGDTQE